LVRLRVLSGQEVCRILSKYGFAEVRRRGSYIIMQKKLTDSTITVPIPDYKLLKIGTLKSIIRQSGIPRSEFE